MDARNGTLYNSVEAAQAAGVPNQHIIPVSRDLSVKELADAQIRLYAPCACGSGKKFKFCCRANSKRR